MASIVIVGAGPRGTGVLERVAAGAPGLGVDDLDVHLVDPYPPGAGRVWREDQSALLWMNSMAADVTMFTDDSVVMDGPVSPGPSLYEWAVATRDGALEGESVPDGPVGDELRALGPSSFASRRLQSHYLAFVLRRVLDTVPAGVRVHRHRTRAAGLRDDGRGRPHVRLESGGELAADVLVLASGHLDAAPTAEEAGFAAFADEHGLLYFAPEQTTDSSLDRIPAGETVLARGMGLAFVDLMVLLSEGRGGRFEPDDDALGGLRYVPSGEEPVLHVGSGRGVPYHAKTEYALVAGRPPLPRFYGPDEVAGFAARGGVSLRDDAWPLMAKEIGWGWYHELVKGHPDRVTVGWEAFAERYAALDWYSPERESLVAEAVPDPADRLDFERVDRPLDGVRVADADALQDVLRRYVADDLHRHVDPAHTEELGAFVALLSVYAQTAELAGTGALTARSRARDLAWWQNYFSSLASGPPGPRLRQMLALSDAGLVRFLGPGLSVTADGARGVFRATTDALPGTALEARTFVEARLSAPSVSRSADPMLAALHADGELTDEILTEPGDPTIYDTGLVRVRASDFRIVDADGTPHPGRFAIGPHTNVRLPGAFTRPNTNALSFRANDALARAALDALVAAAAARSAA